MNVPEALVFGAELMCPCGFKYSFLIVPTDNLNTDNLPSAHVKGRGEMVAKVVVI